MINIAIDGPSGAGKSTVAKALAKKLHYVYVDTGAMYRCIGLYVHRCGVDAHDADAVAALLPKITVSLSYAVDGEQHVYLNGEDVSSAIRENVISLITSTVSKIPAVRAHLLSLQREMAASHHVIMDGRDIGTVILPGAQLKIFLFASAEARAKRRTKELISRGQEADFETILAEINARDIQDQSRETAPLVPASDAVMMDNSDMTIAQNVDAICTLLAQRGILNV